MTNNPFNQETRESYLFSDATLQIIEIGGFKSIRDVVSLDLSRLNVLCGANSSGKSAVMQPLLLFKQTLEASYTPELFRLKGPNVSFDFFSNFINIEKEEIVVQVFANSAISKWASCYVNYVFSSKEGDLFLKRHDIGVVLEDPEFRSFETRLFSILVERDKIEVKTSKGYKMLLTKLVPDFKELESKSLELLNESVDIELSDWKNKKLTSWPQRFFSGLIQDQFGINFGNVIFNRIFHLQGLRNIKRYFSASNYQISTFPGHFEDYTASLIMHWSNNQLDKIQKLVGYLTDLELGTGVRARKFTDDQLIVETKLTNSDNYHNIVDMGVGVSQILPVLVALVQADKGDTVYIEQPEIHLHPNAQYKFGAVLGKAITSNKARIIIETHSSLLIEGIQTEIARGNINHENVRLHWFSLEDGVTKVSTVTPTEYGTLPEWKADFDSVYLRSMDDFMTEQDKRHRTS